MFARNVRKKRKKKEIRTKIHLILRSNLPFSSKTKASMDYKEEKPAINGIYTIAPSPFDTGFEAA